MGRRAAVLAVAAVLALVTMSGVALADNMQGNGGNNRLVGTNGKDTISGGGGNDNVFGRGGQDRLLGDAGNDDVYGGKGDDRLQSGLGQDELFGQQGNDFVNVIDGQPNDFVDCGSGEFDVAGVDAFFFGEDSESDEISPNCDAIYAGVPIWWMVGTERSGPGMDLSAIDTLKEAEQAEADGLLKQIR